MMKKWKRLAALSSAIVMAAATLTYLPNDTLQNIRLEISASAETTTEPQVWIEDNLTWKLYADGTLNISGTGAMKNYDTSDNRSPACLNSDVTKIVIEEGVTSIGDSAFYRCDNLTSITIPGNVESIGEGAFYNCGLKDVTIQDGVKSIGDNAFIHCGSLERITISNSVTSIGEYAFYNCRSLTSITIPDGVTSIGGYAFGECSSLTSITILDGVTSIGDYAFELCNNLTSITIPDSVTSIGESAFYGCSSLKTISLSCGSPLKRTDFGEQADLVSYTNQHTLTKTAAKAATCTEDGNKEYWTCKHCGKYFLSDDSNPETAKAVEQSEFIIPALNHKNAIIRNAAEPTETAPGYSGDHYCPDCDTVVEKGYTYWSEDNLTWKLYADGTLNISGTGAMKDYNDNDNQSPVANNQNVKKVVIENGVTSIGNTAFSWCSSLTSITIPDSVTSIGDSAFNNCVNLTSITIPDGITSIGKYAFESCIRLTGITIPDSVTSIGNGAFHDCSSLTSITIPDGVTSIGALAFHSCSNLKSIIIPNSVTSIKSAAFYNCSSLTSITIPDSVTSFGDWAFYGCSSLTSITIPDSVTSFGGHAFDDCTNLKTISLSCKSTLKKSDFGAQANLVSASHTLNKTEAKAATCTEDGNKEYWTCKHCGKYFLSDDTNPETATAVEQSETVIPASHELTKVEAKAATCTEDGNKEYWTCKHCGKYFLSDDTNPETAKAVEQSETILSALKHKNAIIRDASEPTETKPGYSGDHYCPDCDTVVEKGYTYWIEDNLTWKLYEDGTLNISGTGAMKNYNDTDQSPVYNNSNVKKVVIEDGVTSIGEAAFNACSSLTSITIPDSVTSIGNLAFSWCKGLTSITIPDGVTSIGDYTFYRCSSLTSITIPDGVTSIGDSAFSDCSSLTSITIPDSVTRIGTSAFDGCSSLTSITIPSSVTSIEDCAFESCSSLTSITIPDGVTSIGMAAFCGCEGLTSITIPDGVTSIGSYAFGKCSSLTSITIPDSVTSIGIWAFYSCDGLTSITIPDGVTSIGEGVFYSCSGLTSITIPESVTSIGDLAFFNCISLTSITIPDGVTSIGNSAFSYCRSLTSIKIPSSVTSIDDPFYNCSSLETISLDCDSPLKRTDFGKQADLVSYTPHTLTKVEAKAATCTENGNKEYWTCEHCKKYFLSDDTNPETAKAVEQLEFIIPALNHKNAIIQNASQPTETAPGYSGDRYCPDCDKVLEKGYTYWIEDNLTWKLYEDGTLNISGTGAMKNYDRTDNPSPVYNNSSVKKVVIEDDVTSIGDYAFYSCRNLTSITIPDSVTSIGNSTFSNCWYLTSITIPDSVASIGNDAFCNCSNLTSITIPDSVASIGNAAFYNCTSLTSITIPDSVTRIGNTAFYNCTSLTNITLSNNITNIGNATFYGCSSLTSITIPDSVTSIREYVFYGCSSLTSITIPDSVTSIGDSAFDSCSSLTSITIPDSVTSIGDSAFDSCSSLKTISLSCKSTLKRSDFGEQADLVSYTPHTLTKTEAKDATCTENGNKEYWTCEHCGKYFLSDDTNPETAKAVELSETVIPALVQIATATTPIKCVYGQDMNKIDLRDYVKNTDVVGEVSVKVATGSALPDGMKLDGSKLSGKPAKAYEDGREVTFTFTAENGSTANLTLLFLVEKADPTVEVAVSGDSHTEGDLVSELELILSENSTKGVVKLVSEIKALIAGENALSWEFTPEDDNYNTVTGTVIVNAQTTTTTTTKPNTTTTTKATTTKLNTTTTTKATTTKPNTTTTTKATTTKPNTTTTTKATTTKPNTTTFTYGDVNLDGRVDILDAVFLNKRLALLVQFSDIQEKNADCCQDNILDDKDVDILMQFILLAIDNLPQ